jgi:hypothetical protein
MTQMVPVNLSANETNGACVFPSRPRPASRSNRPDTYQRLPISSKFPLAKRSRSIHMGQKRTESPSRYFVRNGPIAVIQSIGLRHMPGLDGETL